MLLVFILTVPQSLLANCVAQSFSSRKRATSPAVPGLYNIYGKLARLQKELTVLASNLLQIIQFYFQLSNNKE